MSHQKKDSAPSSADQPDQESLHQAETTQMPPAEKASQKSETPAGDDTQPMAPSEASEAGGPLPELDEGPGAEPVDDIQAALFEADRQGDAPEVDFDALPEPQTADPEKSSPPPDEIDQALSEEADRGLAGEVPFDDLPEPVPDLDEGPPPEPVDDIQGAIFEAGRQGISPEVDFDRLPPPTLPPEPRKKISRPARPVDRTDPGQPPEPEIEQRPETEPSPAAPDTPAVAPDSVPLPDFPEPRAGAVVSEFWLILSLFVSFRFLTLFLLRPGGFIRDWSDFDTYFGVAALSDYSLFPFLDFWLEWPPVVPWLAVGAYRLALLLPPWSDDPRLWFVLILGGVFVLFEIGNFLLIYRLACRLFQGELYRNRIMWLYAGLFPPIYAMLGFFDGVALFFILLSLELLLEDRRFPSAITLGVGVLVKIIPGLMLPLALRCLWEQHREKPREAGIELGLYLVAFGLTIILLLSPFFITGSEWVLASARAIAGRSAWETIWAVLEGYYGFGVVAGDRLNPAETGFAVTNDAVKAEWRLTVRNIRLLVTLVVTGIYAFILTRPLEYRRPRNLIALSGLTIAFFMLVSKGFSPQFLVYLLPFIILLLPNARGVTYALVLTGLNFLEQPVYFVLLPDERWLLIFTVTVRFIVTLIVALEFALVLWPAAVWSSRAARLQKRVPLALGGFSAVALVVLTPLAMRAYTVNSLTETPVGTLAGFMEAVYQNPADLANCDLGPDSQRLFLSEQAAYRRLFPYLSDEFDLQLTAGAPEQSDFPTPGQWLPATGQAWILPTGPQGPRLANAAARRGRLLGAFAVEELGTASLYDFSNNRAAQSCLPLARFATGLELLTHQIDKSGGQIDVSLYWRAQTPQSQNLTVFTQILNSDGRQIAGHDSIPRNGTAPVTDWPAETLQADVHRIALPPNLPPGEYRIIAGLYNDSGQRLRAAAPGGSTYANQAIPLGTVQLP